MLPEVQVLVEDAYNPVPLDDFYFEVVPPARRDPIPHRFLNELLGLGSTLAGDRFKPITLQASDYQALMAVLSGRGLLDLSLTTPDWIRDAHEWMAWERQLSREAIVAWREVAAIHAAQAKTNDIVKLARLGREYSKALSRYLELAARDKGEPQA